MQHCDSTCFHCAQTFFLWLKQRMAQMSGPPPKWSTSKEVGAFAKAAATSNIPPKEER